MDPRAARGRCERTRARPDAWLEHLRQPRFHYYDERIVEYSWALLRIAQAARGQRYLDVGCVMNTGYPLGRLLAQFGDVHFLNLVSEPLTMHGRISFHAQDVRACDLPHGSFDCISCLSTLEHVGGDNSYNAFSPNATAEISLAAAPVTACWQPAFRTLLDLLAANGLLLISMPYGIGRWHGGEYELGPGDLEEFARITRSARRALALQIFCKTEGGVGARHGRPRGSAADGAPGGRRRGGVARDHVIVLSPASPKPVRSARWSTSSSRPFRARLSYSKNEPRPGSL